MSLLHFLRRSQISSIDEINATIEREFSVLVNKLAGRNGVIAEKVTYEIKRTMNLYGLFSKAIVAEIQGQDINFDLSITDSTWRLYNYTWTDLIRQVFDVDDIISVSIDYWWGNIKNTYALIKGDDSAWKNKVSERIKSFGYALKQKLKVIKPRVVQLIEDIKNP